MVLGLYVMYEQQLPPNKRLEAGDALAVRRARHAVLETHAELPGARDTVIDANAFARPGPDDAEAAGKVCAQGGMHLGHAISVTDLVLRDTIAVELGVGEAGAHADAHLALDGGNGELDAFVGSRGRETGFEHRGPVVAAEHDGETGRGAVGELFALETLRLLGTARVGLGIGDKIVEDDAEHALWILRQRDGARYEVAKAGFDVGHQILPVLVKVEGDEEDGDGSCLGKVGKVAARGWVTSAYRFDQLGGGNRADDMTILAGIMPRRVRLHVQHKLRAD